MPNLFLLFSHTLTNPQLKDLKENFEIENIFYLPTNLQNLWSSVPPELEDLNEFLKPFKIYLKESAKKSDYILIAGDFGATYLMVEFAKNMKLTPIYATTKREVVKNIIDDRVIKEIVFEHIRFRRY